MPQRRLALIAAATALAGLSLSFVLMSPKSSSGVTIRLVEVKSGEGAMVVKFAVTDHRKRQYLLTPVRLEMKDDTGWKKCPGSLSAFAEPPDGVDNTISRCNIFVTPQSPGAHLRLIVDVQRARRGLGGFWDRLRLRLSGQNKQVFLNPFDTSGVFFTKEAAEVTSEEFIEH